MRPPAARVLPSTAPRHRSVEHRSKSLGLRSRAWAQSLPVLLLPFAIAAFGMAAVRAYVQPSPSDMVGIWTSVHAFLHHQPPYADFSTLQARNNGLVYLPSSLLLLAPIGLLDLATVKAMAVIGLAAAILAGAWLCLRLHDVPAWSTTAVATLLGLGVWIAVRQTLWLQNLDGLVLLGEAAFLLAAVRNRWQLSGVFLGLAIAIKPGSTDLRRANWWPVPSSPGRRHAGVKMGPGCP
jgi:hypothetical protein